MIFFPFSLKKFICDAKRFFLIHSPRKRIWLQQKTILMTFFEDEFVCDEEKCDDVAAFGLVCLCCESRHKLHGDEKL